ncbi:YybH family protein [Promicromonospora sp. NPDC019610]|uniref:YybH family protein n=1 Tax=Promicromonospora sp. NPDC019610 TaxID=3364405 RepID=UPI0037B9528B
MTTRTATTTGQDDEARVRRVLDGIVDALRAKDLDALRRLYTDDVVSFDVEPPLQHVGVDAKLANWARVFAVFEKVGYELRDLTLAVDGTVAFGHGFGRLSGTLADGSVTGGMWVRATFCLRRVGGTWLIAHDQVSVPLDLRSGRGLTDLTH